MLLIVIFALWGWVDVRNRGAVAANRIHMTDFTVYTEAGAAFFSVKGAELLDNLVAFSASAERIVGSFEEAMGTESIASTFGSMSNIVQEIEDGDGILHALIYDQGGMAAADRKRSMSELSSSLGRVNAILAEVETGDGMAHDFIYGAEDTTCRRSRRCARRESGPGA